MIDLNSADIQLKLLAGDSIDVDNIFIRPLTLCEIKNMYISKYYQYLNILCWDSNRIKKIFDTLQEIDPLEFLVMNFNSKESEVVNIISNAFKFFIGEFKYKDYEFYVNDVKINKENYSDIQKVLKRQNCLIESNEEEFRPANDAARAMIAKLMKAREKLNEAKSKDALDLFDLISILTAYSNINIFEVWNLTMFQFNNLFNRLRIMRDFDVNVQALIHGAESKDVKLKHWLCKENELNK